MLAAGVVVTIATVPFAFGTFMTLLPSTILMAVCEATPAVIVVLDARVLVSVTAPNVGLDVVSSA